MALHTAAARPLVVGLALLLCACAPASPPCPDNREKTRAPSAGCFALKGGALLLIEQRDGKISIPGGSSGKGESARCTAHRETWEETGLNLYPDELLAVFDTGFHLYHCRFHEQSGAITIARPLEVERAFMQPIGEINDLDWRFPEQVALLQGLVEDAAGESFVRE